MDYRTVTIIALVELAILAILAGWYLGRAFWMVTIRPRHERRYQEAKKTLLRFVASGDQNIGRSELAVLTALSRSQQFSLFSQVASILSASDRRFATRIAKKLGLLELAEKMSRSRKWWKRLQAVRFLASLGELWITPNRFLDDARLEVRAQAAEWAGDLGNPQWIPDLLELLGDPDGLCRYTVQDALQRIGSPVAEPLRQYLESERSDTEIEAALVVAEQIADGRLLPVLDRLADHPSPRIRTVVVRTMTAVGGDETVKTLVEMVGDPDGEVRTAAIRGIARIGGTSYAGLIAKSLSDTSWNVRRRAGLALLSMGAPGRLLLRNASRSEDRFVRDMSTLVLELPIKEDRE